jgi:hypothetical protein
MMTLNLTNTFSRMLAALVLLAAFSTTAIAGETIKVSFEQPVLAGQTLLPAGHYRISEYSNSGEAFHLLIQNLDNGHSIFLPVLRTQDAMGRTASESTVSFQKSGDTLTLEKVQLTGHDFAYTVLNHDTE